MAEQIDKKESNKALIITGIIIALLVVGLITNGFGLISMFSAKNTGNVASLSVDNSPVLGSANAPVIIYEFSDFSCQYCAKTAKNAMSQVISTYVNTGKAKLVFKYFPTHATGQAAHVVGYALNEQGLFWKFHEKAFANQADVGDMDKMKDLAKELGANMTKIDEFIASNRANYLAQQDVAMGTTAGVTATPTFIVNGQMIVGNQPFTAFQTVIDKELKSYKQ